MLKRFFFSCLLFCIPFVLYYPTLSAGYVWDDRAAIVSNPDVHGSRSLYKLFENDFWGQDMTLSDSHKSYRPVTVLTFRANYFFHGLSAMGYHLGNIVIYSFSCVAAYAFALQWLPDTGAEALSLLFCVHPIHVEAVASLVGRADSLCGLFYFLAITLYTILTRQKQHTSSSLLCYSAANVCALIACFSKEIGITIFGTFIILEIAEQIRSIILSKNVQNEGSVVGTVSLIVTSLRQTFGTSVILVRIAMNVLLVGGLLMIRMRMHGQHTLYTWTIMENHIHLLPSLKDRTLSYSQTHFWYIFKLLYPKYLCFDYGFTCIPTIHDLSDWRNVLPLTLYLGLISIAVKAFIHRRLVYLMGLAVLLLPLAPALHILFPIGTVFAERLLLIPSLGAMMIVAEFLTVDLLPLWEYMSLSSWIDNVHNQLSPKKSGSTTPKSPRNRQKQQKDSVISNEVRRHRDLYAMWLVVLIPVCVLFSSQTFHRTHDWQSEASIYGTALKVCPNSIKALNNHAVLTLGEGKANDSLTLVDRALSLYPGQISALVNAAIASQRMGEWVTSMNYFNSAIAKEHSMIGKTFGYKGIALFQWSQEMALSTDVKAHIRQESVKYLDLGIQKGFHPPAVYHTRASLALDMGDNAMAVKYLKIALEMNARLKRESAGDGPLSDMIREAMTYNQLGLALVNIDQPNDAEEAYLAGMDYEPDTFEIMNNLGTLYRSMKRLDEAVDILNRCLKLFAKRKATPPAATVNNLALIEQDRGNLKKAAELFEQALLSLPDGPLSYGYEVVNNNLKAVRKSLLTA